MKYDFNRIRRRTGTGSLKWDFIEQDNKHHKRIAGTDPLGPDALLPMWIADMDFQTAQPIVDALVDRVRQGIFGYTKADNGYFEAVTNWIWRRHGWRVKRDWVLTTSGVMHAVSLAIQTFTQPKDGIIIQTPVFHPFSHSIIDNGRSVVPNPLQYEAGSYRMDFDDLAEKAADRRTKMMILCSPHNPVGRVWTRQELHRLGSICRQNDVLITCDEIHCDLVYPWVKFTTLGIVDDSFVESLILCNGPSKTFNLPGLKTSNTIIPNAALRRQFLSGLRNLNEQFSDNIFGTIALQTAYEQGEAWLQELMVYLGANYHYLKEYMARHLPELFVVPAEALYLVWIDCRGLNLDPADLESLFFKKARVYLEQGSIYGAEGCGFVRLNIACPREILRRALERIRNAIQSRQ